MVSIMTRIDLERQILSHVCRTDCPLNLVYYLHLYRGNRGFREEDPIILTFRGRDREAYQIVKRTQNAEITDN